MRLVLKSLLAIASSLPLLQLEVGWYGFWANWVLTGIVVIASFMLGYWGME